MLIATRRFPRLRRDRKAKLHHIIEQIVCHFLANIRLTPFRGRFWEGYAGKMLWIHKYAKFLAPVAPFHKHLGLKNISSNLSVFIPDMLNLQPATDVMISLSTLSVQQFSVNTRYGAGWPDFKAVNCLKRISERWTEQHKGFCRSLTNRFFAKISFRNRSDVRFYAHFCASFERFKIRLPGGIYRISFSPRITGFLYWHLQSVW